MQSHDAEFADHGRTPIPAPRSLAADVVELLTALRDALDVPIATYDHREAERRLREDRTIGVHAYLAAFVEQADSLECAQLPALVRSVTEAKPVTYDVWRDPQS